MYTKADSHATEWTRLSASVAKFLKKTVGFPDTGTVNYVPAGTNNSIAAIFFCMLVPV